jgi:hypothetical protein
MRVDMEPSTTTKLLVPFVLTPVTVFTRQQVLPTMLRPGSMMMVNPSSFTSPLIVSISSLHNEVRIRELSF